MFDALTSDRPYRKALPTEEAFKIIEEGIGTQFDPKVAEIFLEARDEILEIKEIFKDNEVPKLSQLIKTLRKKSS